MLAVVNKEWGTLWCTNHCSLLQEWTCWLWMRWSRIKKWGEEDFFSFSIRLLSHVCGCSEADEGRTCCALPGCKGFQLLCHRCSGISPTFCLWDATHYFLQEQVVLGILFNLTTGKCSPKRVCHKKYYSSSIFPQTWKSSLAAPCISVGLFKVWVLRWWLSLFCSKFLGFGLYTKGFTACWVLETWWFQGQF